MKKPISSNEDLASDKPINGSKKKAKVNNQVKESIENIRTDVSSLSYEEAMSKIDLLLKQMQDDNVKVEELYENYLQGNIYLEHCEKLLGQLENAIIELDLITIKKVQKNN